MSDGIWKLVTGHWSTRYVGPEGGRYSRTFRVRQEATYWRSHELRLIDLDLEKGPLHVHQTVAKVDDGVGHRRVVLQDPKTRASRRTVNLLRLVLRICRVEDDPSGHRILLSKAVAGLPLNHAVHAKSWFDALWVSAADIASHPSWLKPSQPRALGVNQWQNAAAGDTPSNARISRVTV